MIYVHFITWRHRCGLMCCLDMSTIIRKCIVQVGFMILWRRFALTCYVCVIGIAHNRAHVYGLSA